MPSQSAAYRRSVAALMEDYRLRILERIALEAAKKGEDKMDLARVANVYPTTAERWLSMKRFPQLEQRRLIAEHYGIPIGELQPAVLADLEKENLQAQLNRIERMLTELMNGPKQAEGDPPSNAADVPDELPPDQGSPPATQDEDEPETGEEEK